MHKLFNMNKLRAIVDCLLITIFPFRGFIPIKSALLRRDYREIAACVIASEAPARQSFSGGKQSINIRCAGYYDFDRLLQSYKAGFRNDSALICSVSAG